MVYKMYPKMIDYPDVEYFVTATAGVVADNIVDVIEYASDLADIIDGTLVIYNIVQGVGEDSVVLEDVFDDLNYREA